MDVHTYTHTLSYTRKYIRTHVHILWFSPMHSHIYIVKRTIILMCILHLFSKFFLCLLVLPAAFVELIMISLSFIISHLPFVTGDVAWTRNCCTCGLDLTPSSHEFVYYLSMFYLLYTMFLRNAGNKIQ